MTAICSHQKIIAIFSFFLLFTTLFAEIPKQKSYLENESEKVTPTEELITEPTFFNVSERTSRDENYSEESTVIETMSDSLTDWFDSNTTVVYNENITTMPQTTESTTITEEKSEENVLSFGFHGEDICMCDLVSGSCDVNCCCDNDCSQEDRKVFSECILNYVPNDNPNCFQTNIIYKNHTQYKVTKNVGGNLFCIVEDNFKERFNYRNVPSVHNVADFVKLYRSEAFTWNYYEDIKSSESYDHMKAGNSLYVTAGISSEMHASQWRIPSQCFTELCECGKQVTYMIDQKSSCSHLVHELEVQCETNTALAAKSYEDFCVINYSSGKKINESMVSIIEYVDSSYTNKSEVNFDDKSLVCITPSVSLPKPLFDHINNVCENVVTHIHYAVIHNGIRGIESVDVRFKFGNIRKNSPSVVQHFSVNFKWNNASSNLTVRSGNPGYLVGYPILAGERVNATDASKKIRTVIKLDHVGLTISKSSNSGFCDGKRQTVMFGENIKSGCYVKVETSDSCKSLQDRVFKILLGSLNRPTYVGIFGNSEAVNSGDWIEILHERPNTAEIIASAQSISLCNVILGIRIDIAFAAIGSLANPQFKIVGIVFRYDSVQPVNLVCVTDSCIDVYNDVNDGTVVELSTTLSFLDVSEPAIPAYARLPVLKAKLPHDFFYPFLLSAGEENSCCHVFILFLYLLVICVTNV